MMERTDDGGYRFVFSRDRQEFEAGMAHLTRRVALDRLPAAMRANRRMGLNMAMIAVVMLAIVFFGTVTSSAWFGAMLSIAGMAGVWSYACLQMSRRRVLLRAWIKQAVRSIDEDTLAFMLQPCDTVVARDGFRSHHPDVEYVYSWRAVSSIECSEHDVMFHIRNGSVHSIPIRLFDDEASRERFLETVRGWHSEACDGVEGADAA